MTPNNPRTNLHPIPTLIENLRAAGILKLAKTVCLRRGVPFDLTWSGDRRGRYAAARRETYSLVRGSTDLSLLELEKIFGCDHSSIIVAVRKRQAELEKEHAERESRRSLPMTGTAR